VNGARRVPKTRVLCLFADDVAELLLPASIEPNARRWGIIIITTNFNTDSESYKLQSYIILLFELDPKLVIPTVLHTGLGEQRIIMCNKIHASNRKSSSSSSSSKLKLKSEMIFS
jgi:hypothetical protein